MSSQLPPGIDLSQIPSGQPPDGVQSNFVDPPTLGSALIGISVVMMSIAAVIVTTRVVANARKFSWADGSALSWLYASMVTDLSQPAVS